MDIQRKSFHALVPVRSGRHETSNAKNNHSTETFFDDGKAIDCAQSSGSANMATHINSDRWGIGGSQPGNNRHPLRTMDAGGIEDDYGKTFHHLKHDARYSMSAQNEGLRNLLAQVLALFGIGLDSLKSTSNKSSSQNITSDSVGGISENRAPVQHRPHMQPVQHHNDDEQGISPVGHSQPSSGTRNLPSSTASVSVDSSRPPASRNYANNLDAAAANTRVKFMPVVRGDEAGENAKIQDQASFGRAVDKTALEYGLDPNQFRAQLEKESGAMRDYKSAMRLEGDLGRRSENNTSIGIGQISRKFLDGREWSDGGPNNSRVGGKTVTTEMYNNSVITQLRVAASNLAMRIQDHGNGDLKKGLNYYVSGHTESDSHNIGYINSINEIMKNEKLMNVGR